jgi:hypothetical protein
LHGKRNATRVHAIASRKNLKNVQSQIVQVSEQQRLRA